MPQICYKAKRFSVGSMVIIARANEILQDYARDGYDTTLRQLYYQFVARNWLANKTTEYNRLGSIISDARVAGLIDWDHLVDRTRSMKQNSHWSDPASIIDAAARSYEEDKWSDQAYYVEVWIEKDALMGVLDKACDPLDVARFSCRGYNSQSEMWRAAQRIIEKEKAGKMCRILHLGDHDPSGIDMSRDIQDRLELFGSAARIDRIALNMEQVEKLSLPPNPAKVTDSRYAAYMEAYGPNSWELDAIDPRTMDKLIRDNVQDLMDEDKWEARQEQQEDHRNDLSLISRHYHAVIEDLQP